MNKKFEIIILLAILALSFFLNIWNNDFDWYHPDELKKVKFVQQNIHDFHHPALMIQGPWVANQFLKYTEKEPIGVLGRTASAIYGTLTVLFLYLILRRCSSKGLLLVSAFSVAVSPILVIHSHYFKEDIIFCCFAFLTLLTFLRIAKKPTILNGLLAGLVLGLAVSSHFKGVLLLGMALCLPLIVKVDQKKKYYVSLLTGLPVVCAVFAGVNYRMFIDFPVFWSGLDTSARHIVDGHVLRIYPLDHFFAWHFVHSIIPGTTLPIAVIGLGMMIVSLVFWKKLKDEEKLLLVFTIVFYFAAESTPLKAFPAYMRYVIPSIPGLIYFACKAGWGFINKFRREFLFWFIIIIYSSIILYPLYVSARLVYYINKDTRIEVREWIKNAHVKIMPEKYIYTYQMVESLTKYTPEQWQGSGFQYLVASSFMYDRYLYGETLRKQDPQVYETAEKYQKFFNEYPYREIKPKFKTFAFSNPTIRIIDIRSGVRK